jgi:hypothetical protein
VQSRFRFLERSFKLSTSNFFFSFGVWWNSIFSFPGSFSNYTSKGLFWNQCVSKILGTSALRNAGIVFIAVFIAVFIEVEVFSSVQCCLGVYSPPTLLRFENHGISFASFDIYC